MARRATAYQAWAALTLSCLGILAGCALTTRSPSAAADTPAARKPSAGSAHFALTSSAAGPATATEQGSVTLTNSEPSMAIYSGQWAAGPLPSDLPAHEGTTVETDLPGSTVPVPVPTTLTRGCSRGTVAVTVQPVTQTSAICLTVGAHLVVNLAKQASDGPRWSAPPAVSGNRVLVEGFRGTVDGTFRAHFLAAAPGRTEVTAESNAACVFVAPPTPPCSLPVFVTTLDVRVAARGHA